MEKLKCASFFAGVGGIDLGFEQTGAFESVYANEMDDNAVKTYEQNFDIKVDCRDINNVKSEEIPDFDVMMGGFPCLAGDTLILTKEGYKPLIDIKVGDMVLSHDNQYHEVTNFFDQGVKLTYKIKIGKDEIRATGNHRFYAQRTLASKWEWLTVEEMMECPHCFAASMWGLQSKYPLGADTGEMLGLFVSSIEPYKEEHVYDIEVKDTHTFIAHRVISHNCQSFSIAGYREGFSDKKGRGELFFQLERIFNEKKPQVIFLENVKNLVSHDNGNTFRVILDCLRSAGYHVKYQVMNAMYYGNIPQNRERIFIVAFLDEEAYKSFNFPDPIPLTTKSTDLIDFTNKQDDKYYYDESKCSFYDKLKEGMTNMDTFYQWRRVYVRENKSKVCPTLTANMGTGGHNVPLIFTEQGIRKLTPKECFLLQGYPEDYQLPEMANSHLYKQAGNSVAVPVVKRIADEIAKALNTKM